MTNLVHGWLLIDKPEGLSSAAALNHIKKHFAPGKIGHAGTLDPFATGILLVAIGEATKLIPYIITADKSYEFEVCWGEDRDTLDITGEVVKTSTKIPIQEEIEAVLPCFLGNSQQEPPQFSAIKINGKRAYFFARTGQKVPLQSRPIHIEELKLLKHNVNKTYFYTSCSKGTYVRAIARDIASKLRTYDYVSQLRRLRLGKFLLDATISLASLSEMLHNDRIGALRQFLMPVNAVLDDILVQQVGDLASHHLKQGRKVSMAESEVEEGALIAAMYGDDLIAICRAESGLLQPLKVLNL